MLAANSVNHTPSSADFMGAILSSPDDDRVRIEYAEWLNRRDDPLGLFILAQVEAERHPQGDQSRRESEAHARKLWAEHRDIWRQPFFELGVTDLKPRRGLVESITISGNDFLTHQDKLFELAPIRQLNLTRVGSDLVGNLGICRHLEKISAIDLRRNDLGDVGVAELINSKYLKNLEYLDLHANGIGVAGAMALATASSLGLLKWLDLAENPLGDEGVEAIACSRCFGPLTELRLGDTGVSDVGAVAIASSPSMAGLMDLDLAFNAITDLGAVALAQSPHLGRLERLNLEENDLTTAGALAVVRSSHLAALGRIGLLRTGLRDKVPSAVQRAMRGE